MKVRAVNNGGGSGGWGWTLSFTTAYLRIGKLIDVHGGLLIKRQANGK